MKDLYLQLGIDPNASPADIKVALQAKPELSDSASILLDEQRRAAYRRLVTTIRTIGLLRDRLGLDADRSWFVESCPDFAPRLHVRKYAVPAPPVAESALAGTPATSNVSAQIPAPGTRNYKPWIKAAVIIFVTAIMLTLVRMIFFE